MGRYEAPETPRAARLRVLVERAQAGVAHARKAIVSAAAGGAFTAAAQVLSGVNLLDGGWRAILQPLIAALATGLLTYWTRNRPADNA